MVVSSTVWTRRESRKAIEIELPLEGGKLTLFKEPVEEEIQAILERILEIQHYGCYVQEQTVP